MLVRSFLLKQWQKEAAFSLILDLASYLSERPDSDSPFVWQQFTDWCKNNERRPWDAKELSVRFEVLQQGGDEKQVWTIRVKAPEIQRYEKSLNERLKYLYTPEKVP